MKTKSLKLLQDIRQVNYTPARVSLPKPATFYLMRLRSSLTLVDLPRTRLLIPITFKGSQQNHAQPVKITHL